MAFAFSNSLIESGGGNTPPKISGTTIGTTMKFLPDVGIYKERHKIKKIFDITSLVYIPQNLIFGNATSRRDIF